MPGECPTCGSRFEMRVLGAGAPSGGRVRRTDYGSGSAGSVCPECEAPLRGVGGPSPREASLEGVVTET